MPRLLSDPTVPQCAWKAQQRLHKRYKAMAGRGKNKNQIVAALGRELLGFVWAIGSGCCISGKLCQKAVLVSLCVRSAQERWSN